MKLVQSAGGRDGEGEAELAPAESCALDDGEEEEIQFSQPLTAGIFNRIKAMTGKVGYSTSKYILIKGVLQWYKRVVILPSLKLTSNKCLHISHCVV